MIINSGAWHMKMCRISYGDGFSPNNLCKYFWSVVVAPLVMLAKVCGRTFIGLLRVVGWAGKILLIPLGPVGQRLGDMEIDISEQTLERIGKVLADMLITAVLAGLATLLVIIALDVHWWLLWGAGIGLGGVIVFVTMVEGGRWIDHHRSHTTPKVRKPKPKKVGDSTLRILWLFLWAKKKRLCPLIEVQSQEGV